MARIYATYSVMNEGNTGVGRLIVEASSGERRDLRESEILEIERVALAECHRAMPNAKNLFLLDWRWLEPEAPSLPRREGERS